RRVANIVRHGRNMRIGKGTHLGTHTPHILRLKPVVIKAIRQAFGKGHYLLHSGNF
ncbi:MAG: hypothetical protein JJ920_16555, partial [Roseitalea sp.]|nr:hypothetical protein [Roseitalea sp.]MBO6721341.1 hypothetical protein [Roseitalea sp.]MBO6744526.1 hypothetical protein [Roseitalea sp.]